MDMEKEGVRSNESVRKGGGKKALALMAVTSSFVILGVGLIYKSLDSTPIDTDGAVSTNSETVFIDMELSHKQAPFPAVSESTVTETSTTVQAVTPIESIASTARKTTTARTTTTTTTSITTSKPKAVTTRKSVTTCDTSKVSKTVSTTDVSINTQPVATVPIETTTVIVTTPEVSETFTEVQTTKKKKKNKETQNTNAADNNTWDGQVLNPVAGIVSGPSGNETYYNLDMSGVISIMRGMGYDYEYWVRSDGVKMFGDYVMVAADLGIRPRGTLIQTSLGLGIVCDTGGFVSWDNTRLDIATTW